MAEKVFKRKLTAIDIGTWKILLIMWTGIYINCGLALADSCTTITGNYLNGNHWQLLNDFQKIIHINGIQDGLLLFLSQIKEDLLISPRGRAKEDIDDGFYELDGKLPCQPDGGLKCFGHPIGASGLRMVYEMYKQLQGKAGPRQIKDPKLGLTHNLGGQPPRNVCSVSIVGL